MYDMSNGNRITTRQFYEALIEQNKLREESFKEMNGKLDTVIAGNSGFRTLLAKNETRILAIDKRLDGHDSDIKTNVDEIRKARNINATLTAILSAIAGFVGLQR